MSAKTIAINRAPVLTLWVSVLAERLGFGEGTSLTLGRAVAALNAQSKGRRLGIFKAKEKEGEKPRPEAPAKEAYVEVCGRSVPVRDTARGLRAVLGGKLIRPGAVRKYLESAFGVDLEPVRSALRKLADSYEPDELEREGYALYEQFRPAVPSGVRGWGAKGKLDPAVIRRLTRRRVPARRVVRRDLSSPAHKSRPVSFHKG
jgi:hypothetical protein